MPVTLSPLAVTAVSVVVLTTTKLPSVFTVLVALRYKFVNGSLLNCIPLAAPGDAPCAPTTNATVGVFESTPDPTATFPLALIYKNLATVVPFQ